MRFQLPGMYNERTKKNKYFILFLIFCLILIVFLISFYTCFDVTMNSIYNSDKIFQKIVGETYNESIEVFALNVLNWEYMKMYNVYNDSQSFFCRRCFDINKKNLYTIRCGACEEFTYFFMDVLASKNIETRKINNMCRDHVWAEINIDNKWIPVETTMGENGMNASLFYDCEWTKSLAYVFVKNETLDIDLTEKYLCENDISHVTLYYQPNSTIIIKRNGCKIDYKLPTDETGILKMSLGKGSYIIKAEKNIIFTETLKLDLNNRTSVTETIELEIDWLNLFMLLMIFILALLLILLYFQRKNYKFTSFGGKKALY